MTAARTVPLEARPVIQKNYCIPNKLMNGAQGHLLSKQCAFSVGNAGGKTKTDSVESI